MFVYAYQSESADCDFKSSSPGESPCGRGRQAQSLRVIVPCIIMITAAALRLSFTVPRCVTESHRCQKPGPAAQRPRCVSESEPPKSTVGH
eukprot:700353-Hanusia_phi.AAC.1